ncbi:MAG TPA: glycoside hydrolase family 38 C-terminal domain-containing protein, partial [Trueperaceae bacterium]
ELMNDPKNSTPDLATSPPQPLATAYIVPHTHWDREWYRPFELFRARLVAVIDRVLDILESDPAYRRFTLDGQAVVLEDYLEIRPERRAALAEQVRAGRLRIGPWYVLADEFLVSPESLIRNLMVGQRLCRTFGEPMPVAYTPDSFGHISQLPLLALGFGLQSVVFERGVGDEGERLRSEFCWQAADGHSQVFAVHLLGTYSAAAALGHIDWELSDTYSPERAMQQVLAALDGPTDIPADLPPWLRESFERLSGGIRAYSDAGPLLLLNGSDHLFPQANIPDIVNELNRAFDDLQFVQGDVEEFVRAAWQPCEKLERYQGEFRGSRYQHILSGVLSSRMYLKQTNFQTESMLERVAEPLAALASLRGGTVPVGALRRAWQLLLHNQPHDSICGCSVDEVHQEMMTRYSSARQLARHVADAALARLAGPAGTAAIAAFNPLPQAQQAVVEAELALPAGTASSLGVLDAAGQPLPSQMSSRTGFAPGRTDLRMDYVTARFLAPLPPLGIASFQLAHDPPPAPPTPLRASERQLENEALRLEIGEAGELALTDKRSGYSYPLALRFEDTADAGDEYDYSPLPVDRPLVISEPASPPTLVEAGPVRATLRLDYRARLPASLSDDRQQRTGDVPLPLAVELSLDAGSSHLRLRVRLANHACDHRLRLWVDTGCHAGHVLAEGHFDVLQRPTKPPEGAGWFQQPQATNHQRRYLLATDGKRGLAVFNAGLPEYEARETPQGIGLGVTLLRAVGWLSRDDLLSRPQGAGPSLPTPGAQCTGEHAFELGLAPFAGNWWDSGLLFEVERFQAPPHSHASATITPEQPGPSVTTPLLLSALKPAEEGRGIIARIWNPAPVPVTGSLTPGRALREAFATRLDETRLHPLAAHGGSIPLRLGPKEVATIELHFDATKGDDL